MVVGGAFLVQLAQGLLPGADHHLVHFQQTLLVVLRDVQAMIVDTVVAATGQHLHIAVFERGAVHPAAGFAQPLARRAFLALQQVDFPRRGFRVLVHQAATGVRVEIHAPLRQPFGQRLGAVAGRFGQEFRHVEANAAGADDRHAFAHLHLAAQHVHVGHHLGVVDAVDARPAR